MNLSEREGNGQGNVENVENGKWGKGDAPVQSVRLISLPS